MSPEQAEIERQKELIERRCKLIEQGKLKSGEPLPGQSKPTVRMPSPDICPSCGGVMSWFPKRHAYLCLKCQTTN
jgi:hypothetical protein